MSNPNVPNTDKTAEPSEATTPIKISRLDKFFGYFSGANFASHYTRQDVNHINSFSSLTFISVAMATTGAAMALSTGLGISPFLSVGPLALGFTQLDRSFVRMEIVERTDARYRKLESLYPDPSKLEDKKWAFVYKLLNRILPVSLRMSMALCTSVVTGNIIIEKMAQPEIEAMAKTAVTNHNKPFIEVKKEKEADWDNRIKTLEKGIDAANKGMLTASLDIAPSQRLPADQAKYDRAQAAYDSFTPQITQLQQEVLNHKAAAREEENGVKLKNRTGIPTCGEQCNIHKTRAQEAQMHLDLLTQQQAAQQRIMDDVGKKDQQDVDAQKALALENAGEHKTKTESLVNAWKRELKYKIDHRQSEFTRYEKEMKSTPGYLTAQTQRGLFADMYLFEKFLQRPGGGAQAKTLAYTAQALVLLFEMAAVLGAATRPLTPSEDRDAEIRAQARAGIRRRVRSERLEDILEERKFTETVTPGYGGPWGSHP